MTRDGEGFPCAETLEEFRKQENAMSPQAFQISLGILQLFCDEARAVGALSLAVDMGGVGEEVRTVRALVQKHIDLEGG